MKLFYSIALFLCFTFSASNAHAATQSFHFSDNITQSQTRSHQCIIKYDGNLIMTLSVHSSGSTLATTIKRSGTPIMGTGASSSITTKPIAVSAGDTITIFIHPAYISNFYGGANYSVRCTLTYTPNSPPTISSITATPSSTTYSNSVTVKVSASDVDGNLSYVRFTKGSSSVNDTTSPYSHAYSGLAAGSHSVTAYAVDTKAASASKSVSFTITKANPSVTAWPSASTITYGQTLASSALSGGKANIAGSFAWTSSATKPPAGTRGYTVRFNPKDSANYNSLTHSVSVKTNKANPSVTAWPSASTITYGQTLASSALSGGKANIAGSFAWTSSATKPPAGTRGYTVRFNPTDSANYNSPTHSVSVITNKATKEVSIWPSASSITYGQSLAGSSLSGGKASVSGSFSWTSPGIKPTAGSHSYSVRFTPTDTTNYNTVFGTISISVNKANPAISKWPSASAITYGQTLATSSLSGASVNITGTFAWTSTTTKPTTIGANNYSVRFTPTNTDNYNPLTHSVSVVLQKATPNISALPTASAITYGQTLASSALSGGRANVSGSFAWTSATTKPPIGSHAYTTRFTPSDSAHYNSVINSINVTTMANPNSDLDGDGLTYAEEQNLGTNPNVPAVSDSSNATRLSVF